MELSLLQHQTRATVGGALAGVAGGAVMVGLSVLRSALHGADIWVHLKFAGAPYLGSVATTPGFSLAPVLFGLSLHLSISLAWGFLFGVLTYGLPRWVTLGSGLLLGAAAFLVMHGVLLPICGLRLASQEASFGSALSLHLIFGFSVALAFCVVQTPLGRDDLRRLIEQHTRHHRS